jgi:hypothetical protein
MDKRAQEKVSVPREPKSWAEWYKVNRDFMIKMQATLKTNCAQQEKNMSPATEHDLAVLGGWITDCQDNTLTLLEVLDWLQNRVSTLEKSLEKRDQEITNTLELILEWKKQSQETLDRVKEYFDSRVGNPTRGP